MKTLLAILLCAASAAFGNSYSTNFPATENPILESGMWLNGGANGIKWTNIRTQNGMAIGTMPGNASGAAEYADSTAVLSGSWGPDQTVNATVVVPSPSSGTNVFEEVELRLRTAITANSITGYECNYSVTASGNYVQIVRWNGALGSWTLLDGRTLHVKNGDIISASAKGNKITTYVNGSAVFSVTDSTYSSGNPGIGFFLEGATDLNANFGLTNFTASDGVSPTPTPVPTPTPSPTPVLTPDPVPTPAPPTNLNVTVTAPPGIYG
jgi:hypothetical protein